MRPAPVPRPFGSVVVAAALFGCGGPAPTPQVEARPAPTAAADPAPSWVSAVLADPAQVARWQSPEGLLAALLDHDFPAVERAALGSATPAEWWTAPAPVDLGATHRAALVASHVRQAQVHLHIHSLQLELGRSTAAWRREHAAELRHHPDEALILALWEQGLAFNPAQPVTDATLKAALGDPSATDLGRTVLAAKAGQFPTPAPASLPNGALGTVQLAEEGTLRFELEAHLPDWPLCVARFHLLHAAAWAQGDAAGRSWWEPLATAAWPDGVPASLTEAKGGLALDPVLLAFGAPAADAADFAATVGLQGARPWADRLDPSLRATWSGQHDAAAIDDLLHAARNLESRARERWSNIPEAQEVDAAARHSSWVLRRRMADLLRAGEPKLWPQARRLGERALDPSSGRPDRRSPRNDPAFLVEFARATWRSGDPGFALDLLQPLVASWPALRASVDLLTQLDAASTIGQHGKASQSP